jgi:hypothetical protein
MPVLEANYAACRSFGLEFGTGFTQLKVGGAGALPSSRKGSRRSAMGPVWNTKYGRRRVKHEPPTLEEALDAAQDFTRNRQEQIAIAASLMALPIEDVRKQAAKLPTRPANSTYALPSGRRGGAAVVVERKVARRTSRPGIGYPRGS